MTTQPVRENVTITEERASVPRGHLLRKSRAYLPGIALCMAVSVSAVAGPHIQERFFGRAWLEPLVLSILIGAAIRTVWLPSPFWRPGIAFSAKTLLEVAVVLLGAGLSAATIMAAGPVLLVGITVTVFAALAISYGIGRALGLPRRMAILVACGNSICGNSAIAAVAPVIGADGKEVGSSIAFTAVLGVLVVLGLPLLIPILGLNSSQFGILAGLTVYAVPQVIAAAAPAGVVAVQIGTLVKLVRVLMLGPVVLLLSLLFSRSRVDPEGPSSRGGAGSRAGIGVRRLVPWFIVAFLIMAGLRTAGLLPAALLAPIGLTANLLTVIAMAALGLGVDVRGIASAGLRVTATVTLSLLALGGIAIGLILLLNTQ